MNPIPRHSVNRLRGALTLAAVLATIFLAGCESAPERPHRNRDRWERERENRERAEQDNRPHNVIVVGQGDVTRDSHIIVVHTEPPPPRSESIPRRPSRNHVWLAGHWRYNHGEYSWVPGHWENPPRRGATYAAPHWERRDQGHIFIEGHWRN